MNVFNDPPEGERRPVPRARHRVWHERLQGAWLVAPWWRRVVYVACFGAAFVQSVTAWDIVGAWLEALGSGR